MRQVGVHNEIARLYVMLDYRIARCQYDVDDMQHAALHFMTTLPADSLTGYVIRCQRAFEICVPHKYVFCAHALVCTSSLIYHFGTT